MYEMFFLLFIFNNLPIKSILFLNLICIQIIGKHVNKSYVRNGFPVLTDSSEMRGIFNIIQRLFNDNNIFGGLQKQNY